MPKPEYALTVFLAALVIYSFLFIFFRIHFISLIFAPLAFLYPKVRCKNIAEKKRSELKSQFRDMLYSMSSSLMAGRPLESAFSDVRDDLEILYPDEETPIRKEVGIILRRTALNESVEDALGDLALRSKIDDIESFCNIIITCRRTGGNLVEIVKNTSNIIGDKLEIKQEIDIMLAARKFEKNILNAMPVVLILILSFVAGDYIEPVFTTLMGRMVMMAACAVMLASWFISGKIMNIPI
jgi:tight adherence protein B